MRNSMPPISYISKHDQCHHHGQIIHTRYTVENSLGAWPGDNKHNCPLGYDCPDPTLLPMDRYGQSRWVEVGAGGTEDVSFTARAEDDWLIVSPRGGHIKRDGSTDTRVTISVDWENIAPPQNGKTEMLLGKVAFTSSDGSTMAATIPILNHVRPDKGSTGAVQGDGYVAIESAHHQSSDPATVEEIQYAWEEIPFYGRTHSGMAIFPVSSQRFEPGKGPSLRYDFWATGDADGDAKRKVDVALQIGPTLNFILGKPLQLAVQMDDQTPIVIQPIPDAPLGSLPADWGEVVSNEIRNLNLPMEVQGEVPGKHSLTLWAMSTGIVAERVILDFGGVSERGNSYLGPPESVIMRPRET
jgi:hypothetical protein